MIVEIISLHNKNYVTHPLGGDKMRREVFGRLENPKNTEIIAQKETTNCNFTTENSVQNLLQILNFI